jgi:hypothetical protein
MQDTRLNNLIAAAARAFGGWLRNPWRRTSVQLLSVLGGFFAASAIATTAGQEAAWDLSMAGLLALGCEVASWVVYRRYGNDRDRSPLLISVLNLFKLGLMYGLFLEAFKLGS